MKAHTPGPWSNGRQMSNGANAIIGDGDSVVAILPGAWNHCTHVDADARLIAAAPELLEALIDCVTDMEDTEQFYGPHSRAQEVLARARAVIAKAKGEA